MLYVIKTSPVIVGIQESASLSSYPKIQWEKIKNGGNYIIYIGMYFRADNFHFILSYAIKQTCVCYLFWSNTMKI